MARYTKPKNPGAGSNKQNRSRPPNVPAGSADLPGEEDAVDYEAADIYEPGEASDYVEAATELEPATIDESYHQLLLEREQMLVALYSDQQFTRQLERDYLGALAHQKSSWEGFEHDYEAHEDDRRLFTELGRGVDVQLRMLKRYGSFKSHLQRCADGQGATQNGLINALRERLEPSQLIDPSQRPAAVIEANRALDNYSTASERSKSNTPQKPLPSRRPDTSLDLGDAPGRRDLVPGLPDSLSEATSFTPPGLRSEPARFESKPLTSMSVPAADSQKENLIAQMEGLISQQLEPRARAKRVQNLRTEWQQVVAEDMARHRQLTERFNKAMKRAYEPSRAYFAKLSLKLSENLRQRKELTAQLRRFHFENDWNNADWREVEKVLVNAQQRWRSHAPSERKATNTVKSEFQLYYQKIKALLDQEYDRNNEYKKYLLEKVRGLNQTQVSAASVQTMMRIRKDWENVGVTRRNQANALQAEFNSECESIAWSRRQQLEELKRQQMNKRKGIELIKEMHGFLKASGAPFLATRGRAQEISEDFRALGTFPAKDQKAMEQRFRSLQSAYQERVKSTLLAQRMQARADYCHASELLHRAELVRVDGQDAAALREAVSRAEEFIAGVQMWPKHGKDILVERLHRLQISA